MSLSIFHTIEIKLLTLKKSRELFEICFLSILALIIPVYIGHPQLVVGILVNALIARSALTVNYWKGLPVMILPSIGAFLRGVLFGPFTIYLAYFMPSIWIGNCIFAFMLKDFCRKNVLLSIILSSFIKFLILVITAYIFVQVRLVPNKFLTLMGVNQFVTALIGSSIAFLMTSIETYLVRRIESKKCF